MNLNEMYEMNEVSTDNINNVNDAIELLNPDFISDKFKSEFITLKQLIDRKCRGAISCDYYRQRATCSWTNDQVNKMLSWVCNGMPLPQIYICEKKIKGKKYSYVIDGNHRLKNLELFINDQCVIKKNGAEHTLITYKDYIIENGEKVLDEYGSAKFELKQFDVTGKHFSEFPEDIQDRVYGYNIGITTFMECTDGDIAYYMRNYNNHTQMNAVDKAMTRVKENAVKKLNVLSRHDFFRDKTSIKPKTLKGGGGRRICMEVIIADYFMTDWKDKFDKNVEFFDNNVEDIHFLNLQRELDRLYAVTSEDDKTLFKINNMYLFLALFHRFTKYDIDDERFIEFLHAFNNELIDRQINGDCYRNVLQLGGSKKRSIVERKLSILTDLMEEYFGISDNDDLYGEESDDEEFATEDKVAAAPSDVEEYTDYLFLGNEYYKMISKDESYESCRKLAHDISNFIGCTDEDDLEYYTRSLYEYITDEKTDCDEFVNIENTPALIAMIKFFEEHDKEIELSDILEWFNKCSVMYSCKEDEYYGKDNDYRFNMFFNCWKDMIELSVNTTVA